MKKIFFGALLLALVIAVPLPAMAGVDVSVSIGLPPLVFAAPPAVVVLPDTDYVYAVPDIDIDLYFWNGWWWRLWDGRWYRSHYYDRGWRYYSYVPAFYFDVDPGWRGYYRDRSWQGRPWHYERIPDQRLRSNWRNWKSNRHWERQRSWDVQGYQPRPHADRQELRYQRQQQYQQRPDVQKHRQPLVQVPQGEHQTPQIRSPQQLRQGRPEGQYQRQPEGRQPHQSKSKHKKSGREGEEHRERR